jgi:hypothetical protein
VILEEAKMLVTSVTLVVKVVYEESFKALSQAAPLVSTNFHISQWFCGILIKFQVSWTIWRLFCCYVNRSFIICVRFQVLTAASMMFRAVFWVILPCRKIIDRRFRGEYCLHHQGWVSRATNQNQPTTLSQNDSPPKSLRPSAKAIPSLWVQLPDIQPNKVLFVKDKLPDGSVFPPVSIALVWTCQGPQPRQQTR